MNKRRIFIALPVNEAFKQHVREWKKSHANLLVRWIPEDNFHVTLVPPWAEQDSDKVVERLKKIVDSVSSFDLIFEKVQLAPPHGKKRMIWVRGKASEALLTLKQSVETVLEKEPERKDFLPHVTLAKFKPESFKKIPNTMNEEIAWSQHIEQVRVLESVQESGGVRYGVLGEIMLR